MRFTAIIKYLLSLMGCATTTTQRLELPPLEAVSEVDLNRYSGTWFDIANFPRKFQKDCTGTTATYTLRGDGDIDVLNSCRYGSLNGELRSKLGRARIADKATNAKLKVSFFGPFWGHYWIVDLDEDYQYAAVGHPGRDYLWILSRTPTLADTTYQAIIGRLESLDYDTSRLVRTQQRTLPTVETPESGDERQDEEQLSEGQGR
jgi:apolipoprotein D and lipocalin family protein